MSSFSYNIQLMATILSFALLLISLFVLGLHGMAFLAWRLLDFTERRRQIRIELYGHDNIPEDLPEQGTRDIAGDGVQRGSTFSMIEIGGWKSFLLLVVGLFALSFVVPVLIPLILFLVLLVRYVTHLSRLTGTTGVTFQQIAGLPGSRGTPTSLYALYNWIWACTALTNKLWLFYSSSSSSLLFLGGLGFGMAVYDDSDAAYDSNVLLWLILHAGVSLIVCLPMLFGSLGLFALYCNAARKVYRVIEELISHQSVRSSSSTTSTHLHRSRPPSQPRFYDTGTGSSPASSNSSSSSRRSRPEYDFIRSLDRQSSLGQPQPLQQPSPSAIPPLPPPPAAAVAETPEMIEARMVQAAIQASIETQQQEEQDRVALEEYRSSSSQQQRVSSSDSAKVGYDVGVSVFADSFGDGDGVDGEEAVAVDEPIVRMLGDDDDDGMSGEVY